MHRRSKAIKIIKSHILLISMASLFSLLLLSLIFFFSLSFSSSSSSSASPRRRTPQTPTAAITQACHVTRFPQICIDSLTSGSFNLPPNPTATQIISAAMSVSASSLATVQPMVRKILDSSADNPNRSIAASNCIETLHDSLYRTESTVHTLTRGGSGSGTLKDARAWMSAALHMQYSCWSGLSYAKDTQLVVQTMSFLDGTISRTSNALSMIASLDVHGTDVGQWAPLKTEREGFWEKTRSGSGSFKASGIPSGLTSDVTVCQKGSCNGGRGKGSYYETVQDAVNAAPSNGSDKFVIRIMAGVYKETVRVPLEKKNLVFLGEGMGKTVITGSLFVRVGVSTYNTATLAVLGDGFMMSAMTVENTAGPNAHQAVAFRSESDRSIIENCEFLGNQDTLYAETLRQYYKSCRIVGNVDFIFGNSASVFENCTILVRPREDKPEAGETNAVTAHGRTDPVQSTGFVFDGCIVNGTKEYMDLYHRKPNKHKDFLGRPWKEYSRTVFINCNLEALVRPEGWFPWRNDFALKTLYYGEFGNVGPGSDLSSRVSWSSKIPPEHVGTYSVQNFIQGDRWIQTSSSRMLT